MLEYGPNFFRKAYDLILHLFSKGGSYLLVVRCIHRAHRREFFEGRCNFLPRAISLLDRRMTVVQRQDKEATIEDLVVQEGYRLGYGEGKT